MATRDSFHQLPSSTEFEHIVAQEAARPLPLGQEHLHYADLDTAIRMLDELGISSALLSEPMPSATFSEVLSRAEHILDQALRVLLTGPTTEQVSRCRDFYAYLAEEDEPVASEAIFVFGARSLIRIEKAVELYQRGLAPRLIVSGKSPAYAQEHAQSEAERDRDYALAQGVPETAITVECNSISIADNVRSSLNILDAEGALPRSFLAVNSPYVQRRGWATLMKNLPLGTMVRRINSKAGPLYDANGWFANEQGIRAVLNEAFKLAISMKAFNSA